MLFRSALKKITLLTIKAAQAEVERAVTHAQANTSGNNARRRQSLK